MTEYVTNDQKQNKKIANFKVDTKEYYILNQYADIFYNQEVQDPETKQNCRLLEERDIGSWIRKAIYAHISFAGSFEAFAVSSYYYIFIFL
jgi:hypothetical protein